MAKQPITDFGFSLFEIQKYGRSEGLSYAQLDAAQKAAELVAMTSKDTFLNIFRAQIDKAIEANK